MFIRLGFAIAALSRPDVLLMDEVLAVGDLNFQKKCYELIGDLKQNGTTVILVSHAPGAIWSVCDIGMFIDQGSCKLIGKVEDVIRAYDDQNSKNAIKSQRQLIKAGDSNTLVAKPKKITQMETNIINEAVCTSFELIDLENKNPISEIPFGEGFAIEMHVRINQLIKDFIIRVVVDAVQYKNILTIDNYEQNFYIKAIEKGEYLFTLDVPKQNFRPGAYTFNMAIGKKDLGVHLFLWPKCAHCLVLNPKDTFFYSEPLAVMHLDAKFSYNLIGIQNDVK